jgi:hypothetical protein
MELIVNKYTLIQMILQDYTKEQQSIFMTAFRIKPLLIDYFIEKMYSNRVKFLRKGYYLFT